MGRDQLLGNTVYKHQQESQWCGEELSPSHQRGPPVLKRGLQGNTSTAAISNIGHLTQVGNSASAAHVNTGLGAVFYSSYLGFFKLAHSIILHYSHAVQPP